MRRSARRGKRVAGTRPHSPVLRSRLHLVGVVSDRIGRGAEAVQAELVADVLAVAQHAQFGRDTCAVGKPVVLGECCGDRRRRDDALRAQRLFNTLTSVVEAGAVGAQHGVRKFQQLPACWNADVQLRL